MNVLGLVRIFKKKYPNTIAWRIPRHCRIIEKHLNPGEKVAYAFCAQKNDNPLDIATSCVVVLTDQRLLIAQKRVVFGYFFCSITPDLFNDLKIRAGLFWGKVYIDTIKELVVLSNISRPALAEIETKVTDFMMKEKRRYSTMRNEESE